MARRTRPSTNLLVRLRAWFGLDQEALALYLGTSPALVRSIETGRRALTAEVFLALRPLVQHLPPAEAPAAPAAAPPPAHPAPDAAELDFRRRVCQQQAARLGRELAALEARALVGARWAQACPSCCKLPPKPTPRPTPPTPTGAPGWPTGWRGRPAPCRPGPPRAPTCCAPGWPGWRPRWPRWLREPGHRPREGREKNLSRAHTTAPGAAVRWQYSHFSTLFSLFSHVCKLCHPHHPRHVRRGNRRN